jgi:L-ascorbate metabolism protein UlaG (beta-lactamase superfamily)
LNLHFDHFGLDLLFKARRQPTSLAELKDALALDDTTAESLSTFLTGSALPASTSYGGERVRIRYFGHASLLIEAQGSAILVDPLIGYQYPSHVRRYSYGDLPDFIDYILITHGHQDHLDLESLLQLRCQTGTVIVPKSGSGELLDPSLKLLLRNIGFERVLEIDDLESVALERGTITAVPFLGEHSDLKVRAKTSYAVRLADRQVLCLADSCNIAPELYRHVHQLIGDVDALFIGMECEGSPLSLANGPYLLQPPDAAINQSRRTQASNYEQAIDVVERFNCRRVYIYAMGLEPWIQHLFGNHGVTKTEETYSIKESNRLIAECQRAGRTAELLFGQKEILI